MEEQKMEGDSSGNDKKKMNQPKLPEDLFFDILSRLPVQSLLRFKCVCKSWRSMISQPLFIETHLLQSTRSLSCLRRLLLLKPGDRKITKPQNHSFFSFDFEAPKSRTKRLQCPTKFSEYFYIKPMCSCDGLILLCLTTLFSISLFLWNPSIRSYKRIIYPYKLPKIGTGNYGLFYDSTADDYRVLVVSQENETSVLVVAVYSLRNDFWDIFNDDRYGLWRSSEQDQAIVNGVVHWVMYSRELCLCVIAYFDLAEGKFKEVPSPSFWNENNEMDLVVLGEFLCVYCDIGGEQIEVCAMMEYGKKDSWTRLFVMPWAIGRGAIERGSRINTTLVKPLCLTKNGQIVISVQYRGIIGLYDPKDSAFSWFDCYLGQMAIPFVETLVSLGRAGNLHNLTV